MSSISLIQQDHGTLSPGRSTRPIWTGTVFADVS